MGQLVFSLVWVLAGTIFLVGLLFEKKKTILLFASVFAIEWSVFLIQHLTRLERRSFLELVLSTSTALLVGEHLLHYMWKISSKFHYVMWISQKQMLSFK